MDSGIGGLSVVEQVNALMPSEDIIYYADTLNFPYGSKSREEVQELACQAADWLLDRGAKIIVVACNTASSAALATLRNRFSAPFVGMVPAIKPASAATRSGKVGVIATKGTVQGQVLADLVAQFATGVDVFTRECPLLAELVEQGEVKSSRVHTLLHQYLDPLIAQGIDYLVLGCTHYSFLRPAIEEIVGPKVSVVDAALPVARQVQRVLTERDLLSARQKPGSLTCHATGDSRGFLEMARRLCPGLCPKGATV
ncbi:MAG: glutamate racemase [Chloroflexi bacterium]|nr:glutamate racemase [Chloroflexota bacterium]